MNTPSAIRLPTISAALEHVRQIVATCRQSGVEMADSVSAAPIRSVGIVGAGIMGAAIAREHAARGLPVVLYDADPEALRRAAKVCAPYRVTYSLSPAELDGCDLVLESISERQQVKQSLYRQLTPQLTNCRVLATNTSTIPITRLAAGLAAPARFCGFHSCHPVGLRPLVEVIPGAATSSETVAVLAGHALFLDKLPIIVGDGPGFVVNRLLMPYLNAALDMVVEGAVPSDIDAAMVDFGMPIGPLGLLDEIGLDTALQSGVVLSEVSDERTRGTELLVALVKQRRLGLKTGAGIYLYTGDDIAPRLEVNPTVLRFVGESMSCLSSSPFEALSSAAVAGQLLQPMVTEAGRLLAEKKCDGSWQIDAATIFGLGFPFHRGGLLWWAGSQAVLQSK